MGERPREVRLDVGAAVDTLLSGSESRRFAAAVGFSARAQGEVEIIVKELATNILSHGGGGSITLRETGGSDDADRRHGVEIVAEDSGPGIADLDHAVSDGFSRGRRVGGEDFDPRRDSLGIGLGAIVRLSDEVDFRNKAGGGLVVTARKYVSRRAADQAAGTRSGDRRRPGGGGQPAS